MAKRKPSSDRWLVTAVVVLALAAAGVLVWRKWAPAVQETAQPSTAPASPASVSPATAAPRPASVAHASSTAPAPASTALLPALDDSDASVAAALVGMLGGELHGLLLPDQIVRRIVATVDALPRQSLPVRLLPLHVPKGGFLVAKDAAGTVTADPRNAARYAPYMRLVEQADPQALATWYARSYPLFQQAYRDLGYPKGQFNDRLLAAIDDMLAAPEPAEPPALVQPKVFYEYADPDLEALSAGRRLMIRMGPANEAKLKDRLRALRAAIAATELPER